MKTHYNFHVQFGHVRYKAVERLASLPGVDIKLTVKSRHNCLIRAQEKRSKNPQSKKDTGEHAPIDRIGVICSNLKGPIIPVVRLGNRYVVHFIDYKTNNCRVFLAKTKGQAAKRIEAFLTFFGLRYNCKIQMLRTDEGSEYQNVVLFCEETCVARQVTEANSPASNGRAERMNRTVYSVACSMIFNSGLPMRFWGDAVKYATYVLNRSPTRSIPKQLSPSQMLEGRVPNLKDTVIFGSPCMDYRKATMTFVPRATCALMLGKSDEAKGYVVYLIKDKKETTTQHVKDIETLSKAQNIALLENPELKMPARRSKTPCVKSHRKGHKSILAHPTKEKHHLKVWKRTKVIAQPMVKIKQYWLNSVILNDPLTYRVAYEVTIRQRMATRN